MRHLALLLFVAGSVTARAEEAVVIEKDDLLHITTPQLRAAFRKKGYVTGVAAQTFVDRKTGFSDQGFGLDIVDWIMEPGSDKAYRDQLDEELIYRFGGDYRKFHGDIAKRSIEGPQLCTQAKVMKPLVVRGPDFIAVKQTFQYYTAAPGKKKGSRWTQWIVFPEGKRYVISMDRIDTVNSSRAMFLRVDMPGHIRHKKGDSFSEIFLSYHGRIPAAEFMEDFAPDERFRYERTADRVPDRIIRAYRIRDRKSGLNGPWLAGMTLDPSVVSDAWCHQRGYVCMIQEFGGRPIKAGESFSAAFIVGFFDSVEEMQAVYDQHKGHTQLEVTSKRWRLR